METLYKTFELRIRNTSTGFKRYLHRSIDWNERLIALKGARGVGKTTLLLQYIKENFKLGKEVLYVSLDDIYFSNNTLTDLAESFYLQGGKFLFLDEVHKYPNWSKEIKNLYDSYHDLKIVFTGSSALEIYKGDADLSRRAVSFELKGLSFREFLNFKYKLELGNYDLQDILLNYSELIPAIVEKVKPLASFKEYLAYGYYPYFSEGTKLYHHKLKNTINLILETDLPSILNINYSNVYKIKKLLYILSNTSPFKPNITKLSSKLETNRATVLQFLNYLKRSDVLHLLKTEANGDSILSKPDKVFLENTNLIYALDPEHANTGTIRETFFINQLSNKFAVTTPEKGDFLVDGKYTFEIGGKNKSNYQIEGIPNAYIASDDIETGFKNKIPLWLFGFLY